MAEEKTTASYILKHRRARWSSGVEEQDIVVVSPSPKEIKKAARTRFDKACDAGVWKRLNSVWLEPANPFEPNAPRRLRREAVVLGSLVLTHSLNGEIKGLKEWPADQRPPVAVPFFAFRIMVGCAGLMLGLVALGGWLRWRASKRRRVSDPASRHARRVSRLRRRLSPARSAR